MLKHHQPFSMVSKMTKQEKTKKYYKNTKHLIKLAIENGYTNQDIAKNAGISRTSISLVSRWRNGKALATERQMNFFIKEFEHLLKRKMEHLFYAETETPNEFIYYKVQGEILLTHTLHYSQEKSKYKDIKQRKLPLYRFVIINSDEKFHVIYLERARIKNIDITLIILDVNNNNKEDFFIQSHNKELCWYVKKYHKNLTHQELLSEVDNLLNEIKNIKPVNDLHRKQLDYLMSNMMKQDGYPFKFILRQLLLKHGYCSDDIVEL